MSSEEAGIKRLAQIVGALKQKRAEFFKPYPKQATFIELGRMMRERALMAANQVGKTTVAGFETRCHATGKYPDWWNGRVFERPTGCWVGGPDTTHVRENSQKILFGPPDALGTGMIDGADIIEINYARGVQAAIDYALIRHKSGGVFQLKFKSYDQDVDKWSGSTIPFIWFDEEPPELIYKEGITRTNAGDHGKMGMVFMSMTPLLGMTEVASRFYPDPVDGAACVMMGLVDALHYSPEDIPKIAATYKPHERRARVYGIPQLGEGAVFPFDLEESGVLLDELPERLRWWLYVGGLDFGGAGEGSHPSAAVEIGWDRETDIVYVFREHWAKGATTPVFASPLRPWSPDASAPLPFAWPHDGHIADRQSGQEQAEAYRKEGLFLLDKHAQYEDERGNGLEDSVGEINDRLQKGQMKIVRSCKHLIGELSTMRREKGKIVKIKDDTVSALRMALMMKRFGVSHWGSRRKIRVVGLDADPLGM